MIPFKSKIQLSKKQILLQNRSMRTLSSKAGILQKLSQHDRLKQYFNGSLERSARFSSSERVQSSYEEALLIIIVTIVLLTINQNLYVAKPLSSLKAYRRHQQLTEFQVSTPHIPFQQDKPSVCYLKLVENTWKEQNY